MLQILTTIESLLRKLKLLEHHTYVIICTAPRKLASRIRSWTIHVSMIQARMEADRKKKNFIGEQRTMSLKEIDKLRPYHLIIL